MIRNATSCILHFNLTEVDDIPFYDRSNDGSVLQEYTTKVKGGTRHPSPRQYVMGFRIVRETCGCTIFISFYGGGGDRVRNIVMERRITWADSTREKKLSGSTQLPSLDILWLYSLLPLSLYLRSW